MTEIPQHEFARILIDDIGVALGHLVKENTPAHRRELVRTHFAAVEGIIWELRQHVLGGATIQLSPYERAALEEESYTVNERGDVNVVSRGLPIPTAIRLIVKTVQRYRPNFKVDFSDAGWGHLNEAIKVRHRLTHPKSLEDLAVSDDDILRTALGFRWLLDLRVGVTSETVEAWTDKEKATAELLAAKEKDLADMIIGGGIAKIFESNIAFKEDLLCNLPQGNASAVEAYIGSQLAASGVTTNPPLPKCENGQQHGRKHQPSGEIASSASN